MNWRNYVCQLPPANTTNQETNYDMSHEELILAFKKSSTVSDQKRKKQVTLRSAVIISDEVYFIIFTNIDTIYIKKVDKYKLKRRVVAQ